MLYTKHTVAKVTVCDFQDLIIKSPVASPLLSTESLALRKASCHVRPVKQRVGRLSEPPRKWILQPITPLDDYSPTHTLTATS